MNNNSQWKKSGTDRKTKSRPGVKTAASQKSQRAEQKEVRSQALKNSELRCRRLFETAQDGILILDAQTGTIEDVSPRLAVMDISLPGMSGIEATRVIKARSPGTDVVMLPSKTSRCTVMKKRAQGQARLSPNCIPMQS